MPTKRLPSFNDFSPAIIGDGLRDCLQAISQCGGDDKAVIARWAALFFGGVANKRSSSNIPATLTSTGLIENVRPFQLTSAGTDIASAATAADAVFKFCAHILQNKNGTEFLQALKSLRARSESITKKSLKAELEQLGITNLSNGTTDHTTLKNWLVHAGIISSDGEPDETLVKKACGISTEETDDFLSLSLPQQIFLQNLRRMHLLDEGPFATSSILSKCLNEYPEHFDESQFAAKVRSPLEDRGWLTSSKLAAGPQGGKSGAVLGTAKLLAIPAEKIIPDFDSAIPGDLRGKLRTPPAEILADLHSDDKHKGGLALELLALRMTIDLGLDPRHFRLRSDKTAHAEVDLIAEAAHLHFSRWTIQCKRYAKSTKVPLSDVAKEVGIAIFAKAHVVVVVTTSDFSKSARNYAREISLSQHLQFLLIPGSVVSAYLTDGREKLFEFVRKNAQSVMSLKRGQALPDAE